MPLALCRRTTYSWLKVASCTSAYVRPLARACPAIRLRGQAPGWYEEARNHACTSTGGSAWIQHQGVCRLSLFEFHLQVPKLCNRSGETGRLVHDSSAKIDFFCKTGSRAESLFGFRRHRGGPFTCTVLCFASSPQRDAVQ